MQRISAASRSRQHTQSKTQHKVRASTCLRLQLVQRARRAPLWQRRSLCWQRPRQRRGGLGGLELLQVCTAAPALGRRRWGLRRRLLRILHFVWSFARLQQLLVLPQGSKGRANVARSAGHGFVLLPLVAVSRCYIHAHAMWCAVF